MEAAVLNSPNDNVSSAILVEPRPEEKEVVNDAEVEDIPNSEKDEDEEADVEDAEEDDDEEEEVEKVAGSDNDNGENYFVIDDDAEDEEKYFIIDEEEETVGSGNGAPSQLEAQSSHQQAQASVPPRRSERVATMKRRELIDDALITAILAEDLTALMTTMRTGKMFNG